MIATDLPPQQIDCPDPAGCPVIAQLPELAITAFPAGRNLFRVHDSTWGYDEHNPGFGDARFSPIDHPPGKRTPSMYLAESPTAAALETVFHEIHHRASRILYEADLVGKLLAYVRVPARAVLGDLRDPELARLGIAREQIVTSPAEHYPCTRRLAIQALARQHDGREIQGLIWHSRQAELAGRAPTEVIVLFGSRYEPKRGRWQLVAPGNRNLYEGPGRLLVDELADEMDAVIVSGE